ncbi:MAG: response regulator, partial [Chthoniobacteraceae bacterium]
MTAPQNQKSRRILVVDDNRAIHGDFRKILGRTESAQGGLSDARSRLFGDTQPQQKAEGFQIDSAYQGAEAVEMVRRARDEGRPFAMAFVDVRMPPGLDGIETTAKLWEVDPHLQIVICTAYSDYGWDEMTARLGTSDQLLVLKKPFDTIAVLQMAGALTAKWALSQQASHQLDHLEACVAERTHELSMANEQLERDANVRQLAAEEMRRARDLAEAAVRAKSQFLANMSHEIRTPMNGIIGMTDLMLDTKLSRAQREQAETIRTSAEALLTIINDILDFSKIEAGKFTPEKIDFDLREALEDTLEMLAGQAQAKGIELLGAVDPGVASRMRGDPGRLRQVLTNLIGNAIKFTSVGEVVVRVTSEEAAGTPVRIRFDITDSGIGISPEAQTRLFQPFSQADGSTSRKFGGTGLGLAICKQLAEAMGGAIGVESTPGKGSRFWFTAVIEVPPAPQRVIGESGDLVNARVLVVDDSETNCRFLHQQIVAWRMRNDVAPDCRRALAMLVAAAAENDPYLLALIDSEWPEMDGLRLAQHIKANPALSDTRVVMLTPFGKPLSDADLTANGIAACRSKPIRQSTLFDCLANAHAASADGASVQDGRSDAEPVEARTERVLIADDNRINQRVALGHLRKLGYEADVVGNGLEVLEAIERTRYDVILMDCQMPEMDGYEATAEIRRRETKGHRTRIIAMTAHSMKGDREECLAAGMDDYVGKPVRREELRAALERCPRQAAEPINGQVIAELLEGGEEEFEALVEFFFSDGPGLLADVQRAVADADGKAMARTAHTLKGACGNFGAEPLHEACARLEVAARAGTIAGSATLCAAIEREYQRFAGALSNHRKTLIAS